MLRDGGLDALLSFLGKLVREHDARVLIVDGLPVLEEAAPSGIILRSFLQGLAVRMTMHDCTALLLGSRSGAGNDVALAMADGILVLSAELRGLKAIRSLELLKFRGSEHLQGKHTFRINHAGLQIYPRWEAQHATNSAVVADPDDRVSSGIPSLDQMCGGGLIRNASTMLLGSPGSGKTLIGLNFLADGARRGEKALYFGFAEGREQLVRKSRGVGLDLQPPVDAGLLRMESRAPVETLPDGVAQELLEIVEKEGCDRQRATGSPRHRGGEPAGQRDDRARAPRAGAGRGGHHRQPPPPLFRAGGQAASRPHGPEDGDSDNDPNLRILEISDEGLAVGDSFRSVAAVATGQPPRASAKGGGRR
ncbi:ATPase domain-containing protein [Vulgatibacter sp.]|uniref:ATPase domain-containing protein n=1 Tax=Vulgatibacter sp. TaxID=1971226 RepID=UPI003563B671